MILPEDPIKTETFQDVSNHSVEINQQTKVQSVLRGIINENTIQNLQPNQKLIVFVSSTFTDTYKERNILQEQILPELQKLSAEKDVQILFYDMRFGVKDESTRDHTTWQCCQEGIRECFEKSDGIFFMSLQGDKYGYRPLPKVIDREYFEKALEEHSMEAELIDMSRKWYQLNENYFIPKFELNHLRVTDDKEYWSVVLPRLRDELLNEIPFDGNYPELLIGRSITEWEALLAKRLRSGSKLGVWVK